MNEETLKTLFLRFFFVFLLGTLGFVVAFLLNAVAFYLNAPTVHSYEIQVRTEILAVHYIPYYLLTSVLFAGLGIFLIYVWIRTDSI